MKFKISLIILTIFLIFSIRINNMYASSSDPFNIKEYHFTANDDVTIYNFGDERVIEKGKLYFTHKKLFDSYREPLENIEVLFDAVYTFDAGLFEELIEYNQYVEENNDYRVVVFRALEYASFRCTEYICWNAIPTYPEIVDRPPIIEGQNHFIINVNNMLSINTILQYVSVSDDYDDDIEIIINEEETTYNYQERKVGEYKLVLEAVDSSSNKAKLIIDINVVDIDKPQISGPSEIIMNYEEILSKEEIKNKYLVSDNYDENLYLYVKEENFSNHDNKLGEYSMVFYAQDSSTNTSDDFRVNIKIVDVIAPVITVSNLSNDKILKVNNDTLYTLDELKSKIKIVDGYDGSIEDYEIYGYDDYKNNYMKSHKDYNITISANDSSNNQAIFSFKIEVLDVIPPKFELNEEYFIILGEGEVINADKIIEYATKVLDIENIVDIILLETKENIDVYEIRLSNGDFVRINATSSIKANIMNMSWYHYLYKWFSILFNLDNYYYTENFFDFSTRTTYITKVYTDKYFYYI